MSEAAPICADCGRPARLALHSEIYPNRPDLWEDGWGRPYSGWLCECGAHVGCHEGTERPLGTPAGRETRRARIEAHMAFDPLWRAKQRRDHCSKTKARAAGYRWLAEQLGIPPEQCHIGMMDSSTALRVVQICERRGRA